MFRFRILLLIGFLSLNSSLFAAELVEQCNGRLDGHIRVALKDLQRAEHHYVHFRWTEVKIRELYYDKLWKARRDSMDPFSKELRKAGQEEEKRLLEVLAGLEKKSLQHSNGVEKRLRKIQNSLSDWRNCCAEKAFFDCASEAFENVNQAAEKILVEFNHAFEQEREFRKDVLVTAGGREGLYAEDSVEIPSLHGDYYSRFEADREAPRFIEDKKVRNLFHELQKILTWNFEAKRCCLDCEKSPIVNL